MSGTIPLTVEKIRQQGWDLSKRNLHCGLQDIWLPNSKEIICDTFGFVKISKVSVLFADVFVAIVNNNVWAKELHSNVSSVCAYSF